MDAFEMLPKFFELDFPSLIMAIVIIMVCYVGGKKLLETFLQELGITPVWIRHKIAEEKYKKNVIDNLEELKTNQQALQKFQKEDTKKFEALENSFVDFRADVKKEIKSLNGKIEQRELEKEFKRLRWFIIEFANELPTKHSVSLEVWNEIFENIRRYEELVEKHGFINNQTNSSIHVITDRYEHDVASGLVVKEDLKGLS